MNDIYRRFIRKNASEAHYIFISRVCTFILTVFAGYLAFHIKNIGKAWIFLWAMSAGIGLVLVLRWFWWRINAWSEISALASSLITILVLTIFTRLQKVPIELKHQIIVIPVSIVSWLLVTYLTDPEPKETLFKFYNRVRPWGFWGPVREMNPFITPPSFFPVVINWLLGIGFIFFAMVGIGKLLFGYLTIGSILISISACSGILIYIRLKREFREGGYS